MDQINRFFIHFWLAISIASLLWALFRIYQTGWDAASSNLVIPAIAFAWYIMRKKTYERMKKNQQN